MSITCVIIITISQIHLPGTIQAEMLTSRTAELESMGSASY